MKQSIIFSVIFREKPARIILAIKNAKGGVYASALAKSVDCTYSHVVKVLSLLEKADLLVFEKQGRMKLITFTKKGMDVANYLHVLQGLL
ncbi:winged helix DNA-binding protein [Candidatus Woesearchaeota archaeon]|nr:winged helix DNA-binding protein [Candidatus Woesearchaeota archaeon]